VRVNVKIIMIMVLEETTLSGHDVLASKHL
jgi:hypothetical protein